jgi:hypothetical protein
MITTNTAFPDFQSIPLCCNKTLWEANSQIAWDEEYAFTLGNLKENHLRCVGDLFHMQDVGTNREPRNVSALCDWNAGLDGLGMLLNIATAKPG